MASNFAQRPPAWFWLVAVALTLWGAAGCYACIQQFRLGAEAMGPSTDYDRTLYASLPAWYNLVFAVAVGAGFLGGLALLAKSGAARMLFILSLIAVVIQFGYLFGATDMLAVRGAAQTVPFPVFIAAITLFSIWFVGMAKRRGWIS